MSLAISTSTWAQGGGELASCPVTWLCTCLGSSCTSLGLPSSCSPELTFLLLLLPSLPLCPPLLLLSEPLLLLPSRLVLLSRVPSSCSFLPPSASLCSSISAALRSISLLISLGGVSSWLAARSTLFKGDSLGRNSKLPQESPM